MLYLGTNFWPSFFGKVEKKCPDLACQIGLPVASMPLPIGKVHSRNFDLAGIGDKLVYLSNLILS